ncbi:hypothetical protein EPUS_06525 [Endocarpon pusillum Z07020]|uniref:Uncharacterized protein n=1 Tax=Endocarpon pusillum (strain Z07020 / HMAS-L-300199) TaxID=1263415 RepID=U1GJF2_ENDPU|nr:uncharacterized protein EPUS_06525 [Endocarpon pusillum Z07020]ERF71966.1 hypothetical protein EPUS_06525 [Endocarpon pusillum Z07020]
MPLPAKNVAVDMIRGHRRPNMFNIGRRDAPSKLQIVNDHGPLNIASSASSPGRERSLHGQEDSISDPDIVVASAQVGDDDCSIPKRKRRASLSETPNPHVSEEGSNISRKRGYRATEEAAELQSEQIYLCDRCKSVDLYEAFKFSPEVCEARGRVIMPLGNITTDMEDSSCSMCRLFASVHAPNANDPKYEVDAHQLRAFEISSLLSSSQRKNRIMANSEFILGVLPVLWENVIIVSTGQECLSHGLLAAIAPSDRPAARTRGFATHLVDSMKPNYDQIRKWIGQCQKQHRGICELDVPLPTTRLMCVDCSTGKVIQIKKG